MKNIFNQDACAEVFGAQLHHQFQLVVEPIIQAALKDADAQIRKALAVQVLGLIQHNYSVSRMGNDLVITVRMQGQETERGE